MSAVRTVKIPEGVKAHLDGSQLRSYRAKRAAFTKRAVPPGSCNLHRKLRSTISTESKRKEMTAMVGTLEAHTKNMCRGVTEGFEYHMKMVYSHFPIQSETSGKPA